MNKLIIVGAGGCGREVAQIAQDVEKASVVDWKLTGFIDDSFNNGSIVNNIPVLGSIQDWVPKEDEVFICAIGNPNIRETIVTRLYEKGARFTKLIHPSVIVSQSAIIEEGVIIYPFTCVSVNTYIGKHVLINLHNAIGHDASIGDYSVLSSFCDITGHVKLGSKVFLGSHVSIVPNLKIGDNAYVGLGSVVVTSIKPDKRVFGNPAKSLKL